MTEKLRKFDADSNLSHIGGGEAPDVVRSIKRDLEGWREVLIPLTAVLQWDRPYFPGILVGSTTFLFGLIWLSDISTLTTVSMIGLVLGILDFSVPYFGPTITGYKSWAAEEEIQFTAICETIASFRQDVSDAWQGLVHMREDNSKMFLLILMGALSFTAWIGNLVNNLLLTYLIVTALVCWPGLLRNEFTRVYINRGCAVLNKLQAILMKPKEQ